MTSNEKQAKQNDKVSPNGLIEPYLKVKMIDIIISTKPSK